jgi:hypothetical protein
MSSAIVLPAGLSPAINWWYHEDANGITEAAERGAQRALNADWTSGTSADRVRDFRGSLVARSWVMAALSGNAGMGNGDGAAAGPLVIDVVYPDSPVTDRARAVYLLSQTQIALASGVPGLDKWTPPRLMVTGQPETGFPPAIVIAIVAVSVAVGAVALAFCSNQAAQIIDNYLARDQDAKALAQADAQALAILDKHVAREMAAGTALPLDAPTTQMLDALEARQKTIAAKVQPKVDTPKVPGLPDWSAPAVAIAALVIGAVLLKK